MEKVAGLKIGLGIEFVDAAVKLVGPRFDGIEDATALVVPLVGGLVAGVVCKFLQGVRRRRNRPSVGKDGVVQNAVHGEVILLAPLSIY